MLLLSNPHPHSIFYPLWFHLLWKTKTVPGKLGNRLLQPQIVMEKEGTVKGIVWLWFGQCTFWCNTGAVYERWAGVHIGISPYGDEEAGFTKTSKKLRLQHKTFPVLSILMVWGWGVGVESTPAMSPSQQLLTIPQCARTIGRPTRKKQIQQLIHAKISNKYIYISVITRYVL